MLRYKETNWKYESGFGVQRYDLIISTINPSKVRREQRRKLEKISFVAFLNKEQRRILLNICRHLKKNNKHFCQNNNLHATIFGFGHISKKNYETIKKHMELFTESYKATIKIKLDTIRPGSMYHGNKTLRPLWGQGNGTVIAIGDISHNIEFSKYFNSLTKYLLNNKDIKSIIGKNFRRKFPTVWITLGYYNKKEKFKIDTVLENIFKEYKILDKNFIFPISELSLVKSKYKNLRYPKLIQEYRV